MQLDTQTQNQQPTATPPPPETQTRVLVPPRQELVGCPQRNWLDAPSQDAPSATMGSATTEALGPGSTDLSPNEERLTPSAFPTTRTLGSPSDLSGGNQTSSMHPTFRKAWLPSQARQSALCLPLIAVSELGNLRSGSSCCLLLPLQHPLHIVPWERLCQGPHRHHACASTGEGGRRGRFTHSNQRHSGASTLPMPELGPLYQCCWGPGGEGT